MRPSKYLQVTPGLVIGFLISVILSVLAFNVNMIVGELSSLRTTVIELKESVIAVDVNMKNVIKSLEDHEKRIRKLGG